MKKLKKFLKTTPGVIMAGIVGIIANAIVFKCPSKFVDFFPFETIIGMRLYVSVGILSFYLFLVSYWNWLKKNHKKVAEICGLGGSLSVLLWWLVYWVKFFCEIFYEISISI